MAIFTRTWTQCGRCKILGHVVFWVELPVQRRLCPIFVSGVGLPDIHDVKPEKNSIFLKNGKTVISVENRKFSRSQMTKRTAPLNSSREI